MYKSLSLCCPYIIYALINVVFPIIVPFFLFPLTIRLAAQNIYCSITTFISLILIANYAERLSKSLQIQTAYFFTWSLCSVIYLWTLFKVVIPNETQWTIEYYLYMWCIFLASICICIVSFVIEKLHFM